MWSVNRNKKYFSFKESYTKCFGEVSLRPFSKNLKLSIFVIQQWLLCGNGLRHEKVKFKTVLIKLGRIFYSASKALFSRKSKFRILDIQTL